jgi:PAS domain S-box-containing protein
MLSGGQVQQVQAEREGEVPALWEAGELVLDALPLGCLLLDPELRIRHWNLACQAIFGFSPDEVLGRTPYDTIVPESSRSQVVQLLAALRQGGGPVAGFHQNLTRDGQLIDCEWHNSVLRCAQGELRYFVCLALDVTERIKSQEKRRRGEHIQQQLNAYLARTRQAMEEALEARIASEGELLRSKLELKQVNSELKGILDAVEEGLILYSRELEVVWSNRGAEKYLRQGTAKGGGKARPIVADCLRGALPLAEQFSKPNGQVLDVQAYPIFDDRREVHSVLEVVRDVTATVNRQAEALRTAHLASLGELAAGVAHEINNPIHGIINYAELLLREFPEDERVCDVSTRIVKESERVARIVRSLLGFARPRNGGKCRVRLEEVLEEALTLTGSQLKKDGTVLSMERLSERPLEVLADQQQLLQVVLNLIGNARYSLNEKYPAPAAQKRIDCLLTRASLDGENFVKLVIEDQGVGIAERLLPKVLAPFFTTKPHGRGTGLGLSICRSIVADHGGLLELASREGVSTTVTVLLPAWREHAA